MIEVVSNNINVAERELDDKVKLALDIIGLTAQTEAQKRCPVDTGNLRNSITHKVGDDYVIIGTNVEYAPDQELGDFKHKVGQSPFLRPAIEENIDKYREIIEKALK